MLNYKKLLSFFIAFVFFIVPNYLTAEEEARTRDLSLNRVIRQESQEPIQGDFWALIIGIDKYPSLPPLESAVKDSMKIKEVLLEKYSFSSDKIIELYDENATRGNIIEKLRFLAQNIKKEDNFFIYYAGHGQLDSLINTGYWIPFDAELNKVDRYLENSVIRDYIRAINSRHTYLVADSCFSGTLFASARSIPLKVDNQDEYVMRMYERPSRQGLTSGGNEPVTDGGGLFEGHSVFAHYFIKALKENKQRFLLASTIFENLKVPVVNNSSQTPVYRPLQSTGDEGGEFVFILKQAENQEEVVRQVVASGFGTLFINATPWGHVYLDDNPMGVPPVKIKKLPVGKHTVTVKREGYKTYSKIIDVEEGKENVVSVLWGK